ncbi:hypothetical protein HPG69_011046 [Diceros bicornis minor]|uniref:Cystathionine gamma-lyase n=1 Tax=Diceros bicornis minor TaxID=77932 RepID=A0A7J7F6H4_DICBM|nr:hypothetical protein HPG69_011046 [Diceros bicornis minor]
MANDAEAVASDSPLITGCPHIAAATHPNITAGTGTYFREVASAFGLKVSFVDCSKTKLLEAAITPETKRPLALGADICMCSATKYVNGHSDVVMGLVSLNSDSLHSRLRFLQEVLGAVPSPLECYLCNRGLKTLRVRMEKHFENGMAVAQFLESNPRVEKVIYPGMFI